jgi:hypothetical protein
VPDAVPGVLDPEAAAAHAQRVAEARERFRERAEARLGLQVLSDHPDYEPEGEAWPAWQLRDREAVLQPPKPQIRSAAEVVRQAEAGL